jgi:hypothetical protein
MGLDALSKTNKSIVALSTEGKSVAARWTSDKGSAAFGKNTKVYKISDRSPTIVGPKINK